MPQAQKAQKICRTQEEFQEWLDGPGYDAWFAENKHFLAPFFAFVERQEAKQTQGGLE